ncbi:hypothetical protein D3C87_1997870 [compost metagenome]
MPEQVVGGLRLRILLQITGRANDHPAGIQDRTGNQAGVRQGTGADRQIYPFVNQIDKAIFQPHFNLQVGMMSTEFRHAFT